MSRIIPVSSVLLLLSGCSDIHHDEILVARYRILAIDSRAHMQMCWSLDSGSCVGEGLPSGMLFAAGFNEKYVVAATHPSGPQGPTTWYFYVIRDPLNENKDHVRHDTKGPFSESEFEAERMRLGLPAFTRIFHDLK